MVAGGHDDSKRRDHAQFRNADDRWQLRFDAVATRSYAIHATLAGLPDGFIPCRITVDEADATFDDNPDTRVLSTTVDVPAVGEVAVTSCSG